jgi:hypothetical protein
LANPTPPILEVSRYDPDDDRYEEKCPVEEQIEGAIPDQIDSGYWSTPAAVEMNAARPGPQ